MLERELTEFSMRIFGALHWFNGACRAANDDYESIVNLSIAFEALLALPQTEKSDRLVDSISLLLGRVPRLGAWARQFYDTRSKIIHEGTAQQLNFVIEDNSQKRGSHLIYQPLLVYRRQIFRMCLGTLLVGASIAGNAGLEEKLVSNQERFETICRLLAEEKTPPCDRLAGISAIVDAIERYRFVSANLKLATVLGAMRLMAKTLLACETSPTQDLTSALQVLVSAQRDPNHLSELEALHKLDLILPEASSDKDTKYGEIFRRLLKIVWLDLFQHYYWIKHQG